MPKKQVIKIKDEVSGVLEKITENNEEIVKLLKQNGELLAEVLQSLV